MVIVIEAQRNGVLFAVSGAHPHLGAGTTGPRRERATMLQHPHRATPGGAEIQGAGARQFRRTPRNARVWFESAEAWTDYHRLEVDDAHCSFVVALDEAGTRILRAWLHTDPCDRCGRDGRATIDLQLRIQWWKERLNVRDPRLAAP
jgi:hypothetical protein